MELLPTQDRDVYRVIEAGGWARTEFGIHQLPEGPIIRWKGNPNVWWCHIAGTPLNYVVRMCPGIEAFEEVHGTRQWRPGNRDALSVLHLIAVWLRNLRREASVKSVLGADGMPKWLQGALPDRYHDLAAQIEKCRVDQQSISNMARLLWQSGDPLDLAVAAVFGAFGYKADPTIAGTTYDVLVDLGDGRRLFVEVTGIEGAIAKASRKVAQVVDIQQLDNFDDQHDRVVIAANVFRKLPPDDRRDPPLTPDAQRLLVRLHANVVLTPMLFDWWQQSLRGETEAVRRKVEALHAQEGGLFIDPNVTRPS